MIQEGEFAVVADGWLKIVADDFRVGLPVGQKSRLLIGLNQVVLRLAGKVVLIDTGLGDWRRPEDVGLLDFERPRKLISGLAANGVTASSIDLVIFSHLHYDHSGGGVRWAGDRFVPTFPNADYLVQNNEFRFALEPDDARRDDYCKSDVETLVNNGRLRMLKGPSEILPGLEVHPTGGHSPGHQIVVAHLPGGTLFCPGDLISTRQHANLQVTMIYDQDREQVLSERRRWIEKAKAGRWQVIFCHAHRNMVGCLA